MILNPAGSSSKFSKISRKHWHLSALLKIIEKNTIITWLLLGFVKYVCMLLAGSNLLHLLLQLFQRVISRIYYLSTPTEVDNMLLFVRETFEKPNDVVAVIVLSSRTIDGWSS